MIAGVPGIGISGVFYMVCAFAMPFIEIVQTIKGQSSIKRWKLVWLQFSLFSGIIGASYLTGYLLVKMVNKSMIVFNLISQTEVLLQTNFFRMQPIILSFIVMITLFAGIHIWNKHRERRYKNRLSPQDL